jgi:chromosome segregation ATPase
MIRQIYIAVLTVICLLLFVRCAKQPNISHDIEALKNKFEDAQKAATSGQKELKETFSNNIGALESQFQTLKKLLDEASSEQKELKETFSNNIGALESQFQTLNELLDKTDNCLLLLTYKICESTKNTASVLKSLDEEKLKDITDENTSLLRALSEEKRKSGQENKKLEEIEAKIQEADKKCHKKLENITERLETIKRIPLPLAFTKEQQLSFVPPVGIVQYNNPSTRTTDTLDISPM